MLQGTTRKCVTHWRATIALGLALLAGGVFCGWGAKAGAQESDPGSDPYKTKCIACHGADGSGNTPVGKSLKSADLRSPEVQKKSDAELAEFIATGKGNMPAFRNSTSDAELRTIVAHVRSFAAKTPKKTERKAQ